MYGRRGVLMLSALVSGLSDPSSSPGWEHCVVFLVKTRDSYSASISPGLFPCRWEGRVKVLASVGHLSILHPEILDVCIFKSGKIRWRRNCGLGYAFNRCNFPSFCLKPLQVKGFEFYWKAKMLLPFYPLALSNFCCWCANKFQTHRDFSIHEFLFVSPAKRHERLYQRRSGEKERGF